MNSASKLTKPLPEYYKKPGKTLAKGLFAVDSNHGKAGMFQEAFNAHCLEPGVLDHAVARVLGDQELLAQFKVYDPKVWMRHHDPNQGSVVAINQIARGHFPSQAHRIGFVPMEPTALSYDVYGETMRIEEGAAKILFLAHAALSKIHDEIMMDDEGGDSHLLEPKTVINKYKRRGISATLANDLKQTYYKNGCMDVDSPVEVVGDNFLTMTDIAGWVTRPCRTSKQFLHCIHRLLDVPDNKEVKKDGESFKTNPNNYTYLQLIAQAPFGLIASFRGFQPVTIDGQRVINPHPRSRFFIHQNMLIMLMYEPVSRDAGDTHKRHGGCPALGTPLINQLGEVFYRTCKLVIEKDGMSKLPHAKTLL